MKHSTRRLVRACVAAACSGFALCASGQAALDQTSIGLERAVKTPTEMIWLRDEILSELWRRNARLDDTSPRCAGGGNTKQGCAIGDPPAWRYVFGGGPQLSRFKPLTSGVYLISPRADKSGLVRAPAGEILLAAGASVTLIDAAYPGIQIELTAPPDQPLPLGNLAAADAGKAFGLLAKQPGIVTASAASKLAGGRVALRSAGEVQVAAARPTELLPPKEVSRPVEVAMLPPPAPAVERAQASAPRTPIEFRGTIEISRFPSGETSRLAAEAEARLARELVASAQARREPAPAVVPRMQPLVFAGTVDLRAASKPEEALKPEAVPVIAAAPVPAAAEAPVPPAAVAVLPEPVADTPSAPVQLASAAPDLAAKREPVPQLQRVASANPDIARLRAEVEAEIERDRMRLADLQKQACTGIGRPMQGCTIASPKRFAFAG